MLSQNHPPPIPPPTPKPILISPGLPLVSTDPLSFCGRRKDVPNGIREKKKNMRETIKAGGCVVNQHWGGWRRLPFLSILSSIFLRIIKKLALPLSTPLSPRTPNMFGVQKKVAKMVWQRLLGGGKPGNRLCSHTIKQLYLDAKSI